MVQTGQEKYDLIQETEEDEKLNLDDSKSLPFNNLKPNQTSNDSGSAKDFKEAHKDQMGSLDDLPRNIYNLQDKIANQGPHSNNDVFLPEENQSQNSFDGQFEPILPQKQHNKIVLLQNSSEQLSLAQQSISEQPIDKNITKSHRTKADVRNYKESKQFCKDYEGSPADDESLSLGRSTEINLVGNLLTPKEGSKEDHSPFNQINRSFPSPQLYDLGENGEPHSGKNYNPNSQEEKIKLLYTAHSFSEVPLQHQKAIIKVDQINAEADKEWVQNTKSALLLPLETSESKQDDNLTQNATNIQVSKVQDESQPQNIQNEQLITEEFVSNEKPQSAKTSSPATQSSIFGQVDVPLDAKKRTMTRRRNPIIQVETEKPAQNLPNKQKVFKEKTDQETAAFKIEEKQVKDSGESAPLWTPIETQKSQKKTSRFLSFLKGKLPFGDSPKADKSSLLDSKTRLDLNLEQSQQKDFDIEKPELKKHSNSLEEEEEVSVDINPSSNQKGPAKHVKLLQHDLNLDDSLLTLDKGFRRSEGGKGQVRSCKDTDQSTEDNIFDLAKLTDEKGQIRSERGDDGPSVDNDRKYESEGVKAERQQRQEAGGFSIENQILQYDRAISEDQIGGAFQFNQLNDIFSKEDGQEFDQNQSEDGSDCPFAFDHKVGDFSKINRDVPSERRRSDYQKRINNGYQMMDYLSQNEQEQIQYNESKNIQTLASQNADFCLPLDLNFMGSQGNVRGQTFSSGEITRTRTTNSLGRGAARTQNSPYFYRGSEEIQFREDRQSQVNGRRNCVNDRENSIFVTDNRRSPKSVSHLHIPTYTFAMPFGQNRDDIWQEPSSNTIGQQQAISWTGEIQTPQNERYPSLGQDGVSRSTFNSNEAVQGAATETSYGISSRASNPFFQISGAKEFTNSQNMASRATNQGGQNQPRFIENGPFSNAPDSYRHLTEDPQQSLNYQRLLEGQNKQVQQYQESNPFNMVPYYQVDQQFQRRNMSDTFCHSQLAERQNESQFNKQSMSGSGGSWPHQEHFTTFTPDQHYFGTAPQRFSQDQAYQIAQPNFSAQGPWLDNNKSSDQGSNNAPNMINKPSPHKMLPQFQPSNQAFSVPFAQQVENNRLLAQPQTNKPQSIQNNTSEIQQVCPRHGPVPQDPHPSDPCCLSKAALMASQNVSNGEIVALKQFEIVKKQIIQEQKLHSQNAPSNSTSRMSISSNSGSQVNSTTGMVSGSFSGNGSSNKQGTSSNRQNKQSKGKNQHICCCCCFERGNLLHQMTGYASDFCKDQQCSRYIQDLIYMCPQTPPQVLESFYREICEDEIFLLNNYKNYDCQEPSSGKVQIAAQSQITASIMYNAFGNFVVQMILEHASFETKLLLSECIEYQVRQLTFDKYGCRIVQKALEQFEWDKQKQLIEPLDEETLVKGMFDELGNHVVQKIITKCPIEKIQFIVELAQQRIVQLCMDQNGCRIVQRILERIPRKNIKQLIGTILENVKELTPHKFGNYVLTHIMQYGLEEEKIQIIDQIIDQIIAHSIDKLGSNVVESCLRFAPESRKKLILDKIVDVQIQSTDENSLARMINNDYGNYVVQIAYEISNFEQREKLYTKFFKAAELELINPNRGFAKHVFNKIKQEDAKLAQMTPPKKQNFIPSSNLSSGSNFKKSQNIQSKRQNQSLECRESVKSDRAQQSDDNQVSINSGSHKEDQTFVKKVSENPRRGGNSFKSREQKQSQNSSSKASSNALWANNNTHNSSSSQNKKSSAQGTTGQSSKWQKK